MEYRLWRSRQAQPVRVTRTVELAPYVLAGEEHLFEGYIPNPRRRLNRPISPPAVFRWGRGGRLDFHEARRIGQVEAPELRAVELLFEMCDDYRARQYLIFGLMPAMGNITRRMYLIRRDLGVKELVDGKVKYSWCIGSSDSTLPATDRVMALKNLIEGEEAEFRRIGNRSDVGGPYFQFGGAIPDVLVHQAEVV